MSDAGGGSPGGIALVDRVPIDYSRGGEADLRSLRDKYAAAESKLYVRVAKELEKGFPLGDRYVSVDVEGEREWRITDPDLDPWEPLEIDTESDMPLSRVNPPGVAIFGYLETFNCGLQYPCVRFLCTGIRELQPDFQLF